KPETIHYLKTLCSAGLQRYWKDGGTQTGSRSRTEFDTLNSYGGFRTDADDGRIYKFYQYLICNGNTVTVTGLPSGHKARITGPLLPGGADVSKTATESGGVAVVDCEELWFPATRLEVLDASDNVVDELEALVSGGDTWAYSPAVD